VELLFGSVSFSFGPSASLLLNPARLTLVEQCKTRRNLREEEAFSSGLGEGEGVRMSHTLIATFLPVEEQCCIVTVYGKVEEAALATIRGHASPVESKTYLAAARPVQDSPPAGSPTAGGFTRFAVDIQGSFEERRIMANLLRVNFFNALESFGWCIAAAGTSRTPSDVLQGIQTDLVVEDESCLGRGEYANFLMAKKGRLKGMEPQAPSWDIASVVSDSVQTSSNTPSESGGETRQTTPLCSPGTGTSNKSWTAGLDKGGGLTLPEVVVQLLEDEQALRWDSTERIFQVVDGARFEAKFNLLRKTRQKPKDGTAERPFSRMHNFFTLVGDKWAKSGSIFRPKDLARHFPTLAGPQGKQCSGKKSGSRKVGSATVVQKCDEIVCLEALAALREQSSEWFHDK